MKAIIDDKLYDTEKAEQLYSFKRKVLGPEISWYPGHYFVDHHDVSLYKTAKGSYFEHDEKANVITATTEEESMRIVKKLNPDKYIEIFKVEVEEA